MEQKRSILIVSQHFPPERSGNASRIYDMALNLTKLGVDIHVLSPFPSFPTGTFSRTWKLSSESTIDGINLTNLWTWQPLAKDPGFVSRMGYYLLFPLHASFWILFHGKKYDLIITSSPPLFTHMPGLLAKKITGKKWIMDIRDLWIEASISLGFLKKGSIFEKITRIFERDCLISSDAIGVTTQELGRRLSNDLEVQKKIHHIPNGVDTDYFYPHVLVKKDQIVYAGNIGYAQDLDLVIRAVQLINQHRHLEFIIAGGGDTKSDLERLVDSLGLQEIVYFPGIFSRQEIPRLFSESLLGVAPLKKIQSLEYAAPTKVYEYMSCCIPFVGCGAGEIQDIADRSGAGVIAENSPEALAEAILRLVNNPTKCNTMGESGRKFVEQGYTRKAIARSLKNLIESIS
ncbi:MAG: glycosyltransferase family 4 protein [Methanomicrobiales archaeon]|nr:glycosyltransferase family 4 protein [Methanomicrobiales archaeon]